MPVLFSTLCTQERRNTLFHFAVDCHVALSSQGFQESAWELLEEECTRVHSVKQKDSLASAQGMDTP